MKLSIVIFTFVLVSSQVVGTFLASHDSSANTRNNDFPNTNEQSRVKMLENDKERPKRPVVILVPRKNAEEDSNCVEDRNEPLEKMTIHRREVRCKSPNILRKPRRTTFTQSPREYSSGTTSSTGEESTGSFEEKPQFRLASVKNAQYHLRNLLRSRIMKRESKDRFRERVLQPRDQDSVVLIGKETTKSVDQNPKNYVCYCVDENETAKSATNPTTPYATKRKLRPDIIGKSIYATTESWLKSSPLVGSERIRNNQRFSSRLLGEISMQGRASSERLGRKQTGSQSLQSRPLKKKPFVSTPSCVSESPTVGQPTRINIPLDDNSNFDKNSYGLENQTPYGQNLQTTIQPQESRIGTARSEFGVGLDDLQDDRNYLGSEPTTYNQFEPIPIGPNIVYPAPYMIYPQFAQYPQYSQYHMHDNNLAEDGQIYTDQSSIVGQEEPSCDSYMATPYGRGFVNIEECIKRYGRDNCICVSTSRLSIDDDKFTGNNDEENENSMIGSQRETSHTIADIPERKPTEWKSTTNPYKVEEPTNDAVNMGVTRYYEGDAATLLQSEAYSQDENQQLPITTSRYFTDGSKQPLDRMEFRTSTSTNGLLVSSGPYQNYDNPETSLNHSNENTDYTEDLEESEMNGIPKKVTDGTLLELPRRSTTGILGNLQAARGVSSGYLEMTAKPSVEDFEIDDSAEINNEDASSSEYLGLTNYGTTEHSYSSSDVGNEHKIMTDYHEPTSSFNYELSIDDNRAQPFSNNYDETSSGNLYYTTQPAVNIISNNNPKITTNGDSGKFLGSHYSFPDETSTTTIESFRFGMPVSHSPRMFSSTTTERFGRSNQNPSTDEFYLGRELEEIDATEDSSNDCITDQSILGETIATEMTFATDDHEQNSRGEPRYLSKDQKATEKTDDKVVGEENDAAKNYYDEMTSQPYEESKEEFSEESYTSSPSVSTIIHKTSSVYPNVLRSEIKMAEQTSIRPAEANRRNSEEAIIENKAKIGEDYDENFSSKDIPESTIVGMNESSRKKNVITTDKNLSSTTDRVEEGFSDDIVGNNRSENDSTNIQANNSPYNDNFSSEEECTEEISKDDLSSEDGTFLRTAVEKVLNDLVSSNSNSLEDGADNLEAVALAQQDPLSGINDMSILKNLFTLPEVREMAIETVKEFIDGTSDSAQQTALGRLSDETIGSVFDKVIRNTLPGTTPVLSSSMIVNEDEHENGQWATRSVNSAPNDDTIEEEYNDEISSRIENIIGHPGIGLERAKLPSVQNIIVKTVANGLKNAEQNVNHSAILEALKNIISRAETSGLNSLENVSHDKQLSGAQDIERSYDSVKDLPIVPVTEHFFTDGHWVEQQAIVGNTRKDFEPKMLSSTTSRRHEKIPSSTLSYESSNIKASQYGSTPRAMDYALLGDSGSNEDGLTTDYEITGEIVGVPISTAKSTSVFTTGITNENDMQKMPTKYYSPNSRMVAYIKNQRQSQGTWRSDEEIKLPVQSPTTEATTENYSPPVEMRSRQFSTTTESLVELSQTSGLSSPGHSEENVGETLATDYPSTENIAAVTESLSSSASTTPATSRSRTNEAGVRKNLRKPGGGKFGSEEAMKVALQSSSADLTTENYSPAVGIGSRQFSTTEGLVGLSRSPGLSTSGYSEENLGELLATDYPSTENIVEVTESLSSSASTTPAISRSRTNEAGVRKNLRKPGGGKFGSEEAMRVALQSSSADLTTENYSPSVRMGSRQFSTTEGLVGLSRSPGLSTPGYSEENLGEILATDYPSTENIAEVTESLSSSASTTPAISRSRTNEAGVRKNLRKPGGGKFGSEEAMRVALQSSSADLTTENYSPSVRMGSRQFSTTEGLVGLSRSPGLSTPGYSEENLGEILATDYPSTENIVGVTEILASSTDDIPEFSRSYTNNEDVQKIPTKYYSSTNKMEVASQSTRSDLTTENYSSSVKLNSKKISEATESSLGLVQAPESYSESATAISSDSSRGSTKKSKTKHCNDKKKKNSSENVESRLNIYQTKSTSLSPVERNYSKSPTTVTYSDIDVGAENIESARENYVGDENFETQTDFDDEITDEKTSKFSTTNYPSTVNIKNQQYRTKACIREKNPTTTKKMEENGDVVENTQSPISQSGRGDIYRNEEGNILTSVNFAESGEEEIYDGHMELSSTQHSYAGDNNRYTTEEYFETENVETTKKHEESDDKVGMTKSSITQSPVYNLLYDDDDETTKISSTEDILEESNYSAADDFEENSKEFVQDLSSSEILEAENYENVNQGVTKSGYIKNGKNTENQLESINRNGESTSEKIQKFTKNSNDRYSIAEFVTRKSIGAARGRQESTYLEEFSNEQVGISQDETANNDEDALSTNGGSNYVNPVYDPTYFGKITLNSLNPDNDKISDLKNTELFYVGDGVKIPLKLSRTSDGSWALSISEKICENYVKQKCSCCVSTDGNIVEETTDNSAFQSDPKKRYARSTVASNVISTITTPVKKFATKYNLTLDPTDCPQHESIKSWRQMKSKPTTVMNNRRRNRDAETLRNGQLLKLFQNNNQIQRDNSDENEDRIIVDNDKEDISKGSNAIIRTELTFDTNTDEFIENLKQINDMPEDKRAEMVVHALDDFINSVSAQNLDPMLDPYSVVESADENITKDRLGKNYDYDLVEMANQVAKYGYQKDNPIWERIRFIINKQNEQRPYRYQRNIDRQVASRINVVKTVLGWLKQVVLESEANNET